MCDSVKYRMKHPEKHYQTIKMIYRGLIGFRGATMNRFTCAELLPGGCTHRILCQKLKVVVVFEHSRGWWRRWRRYECLQLQEQEARFAAPSQKCAW